VDIHFRNNKLEKVGNSIKDARRVLGNENGRKLLQRLDEIRDSNTLFDLKQLPAAKCHLLTGDRKGFWAVSLSEPYRLLFKPYHDPVPLLEDGSLDLKRITAVRIEEIEDYHGKKRKK
jgi:toxin HigB-1